MNIPGVSGKSRGHIRAMRRELTVYHQLLSNTLNKFLVTTIAENIDTKIPIANVSANPLITPLPK